MSIDLKPLLDLKKLKYLLIEFPHERIDFGILTKHTTLESISVDEWNPAIKDLGSQCRIDGPINFSEIPELKAILDEIAKNPTPE